MKKYININSIGVILMLLFPTILLAQPGFDDDVSDVPVDGGLSLLVAAGIGYSVKKIRDKKINQ
ncbi:MAG: PID-CTERM protein-sorting domain-containing protein [Chitinophagaceae bacterium]|jgi:hypothetical protein